MSDLIQEFLQRKEDHLAVGSIGDYRSHLDGWLKFNPRQATDGDTVLRYRRWLSQRGLKENTVKQHIRTLSAFLSFLMIRKVIGENPALSVLKSIRVVHVKREPITEPEYEALLKQVDETDWPWWSYGIRMGWETGLRLGDIAMLNAEDVDLPSRAIRLIPRKTKRHQTLVEIPISQSLADLISGMLDGKDNGVVEPRMAYHYEQWQHRVLSAQFLTLCKLAGVKGKSFHCFRHGFITRHLDRNVSPVLLADMTGISLNRVMTYARPGLEKKREALGL